MEAPSKAGAGTETSPWAWRPPPRVSGFFLLWHFSACAKIPATMTDNNRHKSRWHMGQLCGRAGRGGSGEPRRLSSQNRLSKDDGARRLRARAPSPAAAPAGPSPAAWCCPFPAAPSGSSRTLPSPGGETQDGGATCFCTLVVPIGHVWEGM